MDRDVRTPSFGERWTKARPTKTMLFWSMVLAAVLTMVVGFTWGGWVRGVTAQSIADTRAEDAIVKHLAPICVFQSREDPANAEKIKALKELSMYERGDYVTKQGWANMPGGEPADSRVAEECARLLAR
jgi:hypothetical protein